MTVNQRVASSSLAGGAPESATYESNCEWLFSFYIQITYKSEIPFNFRINVFQSVSMFLSTRAALILKKSRSEGIPPRDYL